MSELHVVKLEIAHLSPDLSVYCALFTDVRNAAFLRKQLISQNADFEYAFIDATKVLSLLTLKSAVFRACNDLANKRLKSHNVHSEIVYSLSQNNNIGDALKKFGISDSTKDLLVVKVLRDGAGRTSESVKEHLSQAVEGNSMQVTDEELLKVVNLAEIRKVYKIPETAGLLASQAGRQTTTDGEKRQELEMLILGGIALRGAL